MDIVAFIKQSIAIIISVVLALAVQIGVVPPPPQDPAMGALPASTEFPTATSTSQAEPASASQELPLQKSSGLPSGASTAAGSGGPDFSRETPALPGVPQPSISDTELNNTVRAALANVLCTTLAGGDFKPISGSGVVIDGRGVVLTNAHVAQFFLLRDYIVPGNVTCIIRTGSPATPTYTAELLYLPKSWIDANASQIKQQVAHGTGEHDFAFLRITGTTNPSASLPAVLPHLPYTTTPPKVGDTMLLASYPAGFLSGDFISKALYASSAFAGVSKVFSFDGGPQTDTFAVGGTVASQAGSSGGAVASRDAKLRGLITTALLGATTDQSDLFAITIGHISRTLAAEGKGGIELLLEGDLAAKAAQFNATTAQEERATLEAALRGN